MLMLPEDPFAAHARMMAAMSSGHDLRASIRCVAIGMAIESAHETIGRSQASSIGIGSKLQSSILNPKRSQ